jgi:hypothetical protein
MKTLCADLRHFVQESLYVQSPPSPRRGFAHKRHIALRATPEDEKIPQIDQTPAGLQNRGTKRMTRFDNGGTTPNIKVV